MAVAPCQAACYRASAAVGWKGTNLRTTMLKLIRRAGLKAWPKPFHNLRASCETDLMQHHPIHVVTAWIGIRKLKDDAIPLANKLGRGGQFLLNGIDLGKPDVGSSWSAERAMKAAGEAFEKSLDALAAKFELRNSSGRVDLGALAGGLGMLKADDLRKAREGFRLDDAPPMKRATEVKLPSAAAFGSQAAADLYARANSGETSVSQQVLDVERQQLAVLREIERSTRNPAPPPPAIQLPPW